jgi:hypothetical protein
VKKIKNVSLRVSLRQNHKKFKAFVRAFLEIGFILFLYYSNLLMGEYTHSGKGQIKGLKWAVTDIFTINNFIIAIITATACHFIFEVLRKRIK